MNIEDLRKLCLSLPEVTEDMPYDDTVLAFRLKGKIFACCFLDKPHQIVVKCDPDKALELRERFSEIEGAFHCNKKYWNQIRTNGSVGSALIRECAIDAWNEVNKKLPKKDRFEPLSYGYFDKDGNPTRRSLQVPYDDVCPPNSPCAQGSTPKKGIPVHSSLITDIMMGMRDDQQAANLSRFFKTGKGQYGEGDLFLGIKVPQTREVVKRHWMTCEMDELEIMIASSFHEIRLCALLILVHKFKHAKKSPLLQKQYIDFYLSHTSQINNWDLVDLSCYELLGEWLLTRDRSILYDLARNGKSIWEQRIAIVSCMQFVRHGEYDDCLAIADLLLHHPHDLLHKAVGWLLREVGKHDGLLLREYLSSRYLTMPRTTLRYAIEKFPESERATYLKSKI